MAEKSDQLSIGVDLGATKIAAALVAPDGAVLASRQALTEPQLGIPSTLERIASQINELLRFSPGSVLGIGIGSPGQVLSDEGVVCNAVNLGWEKIHLADEIRARLLQELPVWIQKDANASAVGEYYFGSARACRDFVYLGVGSGLGGGILSAGRLVTGADWNAAEVGHLSLDPQGLPCACGGRGCAETIVSGPGLLKLVQSYLRENRFPSRLQNTPDLTTQEILAAARSEDPLALEAFNQLGRNLGMVMAACVALLNPALFVIGGGLGLAAFDKIVPPALGEVQQRTLRPSYQNLKILPSKLPSSAIGAACLTWYFTNAITPNERR